MILLALQDEIKALIEKQQSLMGRLKKEEVICGHESNNSSLSPAELERQMSALSSDKMKVQALESTIAVIGTMKAGKSTTINALIGEEVLPHRLTAMTTLPTLIRHKPGQKEPVLKLHKLDVFKGLVDEVKAQVSAVDDHGFDLSKINEALDTVKKRSEDIREEYVGKDAIHQALFLINDTFRLAGHDSFDVDLSKYLQHFTDIGSLPTVEIEFRCLAGKPEGTHAGSLALLDTPGPNEAGQSTVLRNILSKQIEMNASMVLLVMNYTQINTEQDADIRSQIRGIKEVFRDRSFVVVNRFDEKKHNDLDADQTKKLASDLLNDSIDDDEFISAEEVFPVSSHYAFIVERVRQQIGNGVELSNFLQDEQNQDFIKAAFGMLDDDEIEDLTYEQIKTKCTRLLKRSGYEVFINNMLTKAYTKAGESSLQAALARLHDNVGKIDRFATVVRGGLAQEMDALVGSIERTRKLSQSIEVVYRKLDHVKSSGINEYRNNALAVLGAHVAEIKNRIGKEFARERELLLVKLEDEFKEKSGEKMKQKRNAYSVRFHVAKKELYVIESELENLRAEIDKHAKGNDGVLDFGGDKNAALKFDKKALGIINSMFTSMVESLQQQLNQLEEKTRNEIQIELFGQLDALCKEYEAEMQEKGFVFDVSLSNSFSLNILEDAVINVDSSNAFESYSQKVNRKWNQQVQRDGFVHKVLKLLSFGQRSDWTIETKEETYDQEHFRIYLDKYVKNAADQADKFYKEIDSRLAKQFEEKLVPAVDDVFAEVIKAVSGIEEALDQSKKLKAESVAVISKVRDMMDGVKTENTSHLNRIGVARLGIDSLVAGK